MTSTKNALLIGLGLAPGATILDDVDENCLAHWPWPCAWMTSTKKTLPIGLGLGPGATILDDVDEKRLAHWPWLEPWSYDPR